MPRPRPVYLALVSLAVVCGLASRRFRAELPSLIGVYAGDTFWAAMIFFIAAAIWNRATTRTLAFGAILFCLAIELSQLNQTSWINAVRSTRIGGLILGFGFLWSDLLCYLVGVVVAAGIDNLLVWAFGRNRK